jgi:hypothetical protein
MDGRHEDEDEGLEMALLGRGEEETEDVEETTTNDLAPENPDQEATMGIIQTAINNQAERGEPPANVVMGNDDFFIFSSLSSLPCLFFLLFLSDVLTLSRQQPQTGQHLSVYLWAVFWAVHDLSVCRHHPGY